MVKTKKSNFAEVSSTRELEQRLGVKSKFKSCSFRRGLLANEKNLKDGLKSIEDLIENLQINKPLLVSSQICSICAFNFNNQERLPICLPCGHTVCKVCVYALKHSPLTGVCPYDRKEYFFIQELLPINFSLLYTENIEESRACSVHGYEIVAYCIEHESLLCGKCLISHLSHRFLDIESEQVKDLAKEKSVFFDIILKKIEDFFKTWQKLYSELHEIYEDPVKSLNFLPQATRQLLFKSLSQAPFIKLQLLPELLTKVQTVKESFLSSSPLSQFKSSFPELTLPYPDPSFLKGLLSA